MRTLFLKKDFDFNLLPTQNSEEPNFLTISIIFSLILFLLGAIVRGIRKIKGR
jgi:hypothetical protein